ncbi:alpha/beta hydrolase [Deinococcus sp. HMF7620]|uniref:Alpha/beta hydrolase n=1 Tax=Deinococcus arboris TaxID=2682977 RepID=A0A7C9HRZ8_9DEIO|nr:alpha/beta hydrolase [Deinococcus arboris]
MKRAAVLLFSVLCAASVSAGALTPPPPSLDIPATPPAWVSLGAPDAPSWLQAPATCAARPCSLVVVSHPRGQSAERLRDSPQVGVLTSTLLQGGFAVLLSSDGGPATWGSPAALSELGATHAAATRRFAWNGRTFALGLSMGGLMALRSALPGAPYPVSGLALIDAWVDLDQAYGTAVTRRTEIQTAYTVSGALPAALNPLVAAQTAPRQPLLTVFSEEDQTVPHATNSARLFEVFGRHPDSVQLRVSGAHLGGNRFTPELGAHLAAFFGRLEARTPAPTEVPMLRSR